jgi:hypothetical protein
MKIAVKKTRLEKRIDKAIRLLHEQGQMPNSMLRENLSLENNQGAYAKLKQSLLERALVSMYRCRGGGVRLTAKGEKEAARMINAESKNIVKKEAELYEPLCQSLTLAAEQDMENCFVEVIGGATHNGKWSNPDLVKVTVETYEFLKIKRVLVSTFEVKKFDGLNVDSVFEALAHARFAHYVYLVAEANSKSFVPPFDVASLCQSHGVGLLKMYKHYQHYKHEILIQPRMQAALDDDVEYFLARFFDKRQESKDKYQDLTKNYSVDK